MKSSNFKVLLFIFPPLIGYLVYAMFRLSLGVVLPSIQLTYGIFEAQAGVLVSTSLLSIAIAMVLGGYLADRIGITATFLAGLILLTTGLWLTSIASTFINIVGFLALASLGGGIINPTVYVWLGEHLPKSRGLVLGLGNAVFFIGGMLGPWLTGILLVSHTWDVSFKFFALVSFVALLVYLPSTRTLGYKVKAKALAFIQGYRKLLKMRNVLVLYSSMFTVNFAFITFVTWTPTFLLIIQGLNIAETGLAMASFSIAAAIGSIILGYISDRLGRRILTFALGLTSAFLTYLLYSSALSFPMIITLISLCGFLFGPYWNLLLTLAQETVGTSMVGTVTGLVQNGAIIGGIPSPILVGIALNTFGISSAMIYGVSVFLLFYSVIILGYKKG